MRQLSKVEFYSRLGETSEGKQYLSMIKNISLGKEGSVLETHHIHPRSLGGEIKNTSNLIQVTCYEHCVLHYLLAKALPCFETFLPIIKMSYGQYTKLSDLEKISLEEIYGWSELRKQSFKGGFKVMTFQDKAYHIPLEQISEYLGKGYVLGPPNWMNVLQGKGHKGHVRIHKGNVEKLVSNENLESFLKDGWIKGCTDEHRRKSSQTLIGKVCIHKGSYNKIIHPDKLPEYIKDGWLEGRSKDVLQTVKEACIKNKDLRQQRSREEAASRKLIYTRSSKFRSWWLKNIETYQRPQYAVCHFLKELGVTKQSFLEDMKTLNEI